MNIKFEIFKYIQRLPSVNTTIKRSDNRNNYCINFLSKQKNIHIHTYTSHPRTNILHIVCMNEYTRKEKLNV